MNEQLERFAQSFLKYAAKRYLNRAAKNHLIAMLIADLHNQLADHALTRAVDDAFADAEERSLREHG
jgi:hypothetical protein